MADAHFSFAIKSTNKREKIKTRGGKKKKKNN